MGYMVYSIASSINIASSSNSTELPLTELNRIHFQQDGTILHNAGRNINNLFFVCGDITTNASKFYLRPT